MFGFFRGEMFGIVVQIYFSEDIFLKSLAVKISW